MKIFQVISSLGNGGAEKLVVELANELSKNNEVSIISIKNILPSMFHAKNISEQVDLYTLNKRKGFDFRVLIQLIRIIKKQRPDVVHIHLNMTLLYFLLLIPFFRRIKFYYTIHSDIVPHKKLFNWYRLLPFFHRITCICLTNEILAKFQGAYPGMRFVQISSGISKVNTTQNILSVEKEFEVYRKNDYTKVLLFIGRLSYAKNIPILIETFESLIDKNVVLLIIGKGDPEIEKSLINRSSQHNNIFFLGPKGNVGDYLINSDSLILTSRHEGLPIVVLEALSCGLPIISTPVGGLVNVINQFENGFLTKTQGKQDIIKAINDFLSLNTDDLHMISQNNKKLFYEKYSIEICARQHIEKYSE